MWPGFFVDSPLRGSPLRGRLTAFGCASLARGSVFCFFFAGHVTADAPQVQEGGAKGVPACRNGEHRSPLK